MTCCECGAMFDGREEDAWMFCLAPHGQQGPGQPRGNESRSRNSPATACRGPLSEAFFADFETVPLPETATLSRVILASYIIVSAARRIVATVFPSSGYVASPKLPDTPSDSPAPSRQR